MKISKISGCLVVALLVSAMACADGVQTLIAVGKSQAEMEKSLKAEDQAYSSVKDAVETGQIKQGITSADLSAKYGNPSVKIGLEDGKMKWVYKSASASYFEGEKIYVFFDAGGVCYQTQIVSQDK